MKLILCFLTISGSPFLSPSQHVRWSAVPSARCCGGQGLTPLASGRLDGPVLTGTRRRTSTCWNPSCSQPRWKSTSGPVNYGKPLRLRGAAAIHLWQGYSALTQAARVPLQPSGLPPQPLNGDCSRNAERCQVNLEGSSPGMAMNSNKEQTSSSRCPPSVAMRSGPRPKPS